LLLLLGTGSEMKVKILRILFKIPFYIISPFIIWLMFVSLFWNNILFIFSLQKVN